MKTYTTNRKGILHRFMSFLGTGLISVFMLHAVAFSQQAPVTLGLTDGFAILSYAGITNTGPTSITGDVGVSPITGASLTGFETVTIDGTIYTVDAAGPNGYVTNPILLTQAMIDLTTAYNDAAGRTVNPIGVAGNLGGQTLPPGLYKSTSSLEISSGDLTLDAQGDTNAVWIFQIASSFNMTSGRQVVLIGGAKASNIFWQVGSAATFGTTAVMKGTIMAYANITFATGASLEGRALARTESVTLDANTIGITRTNNFFNISGYKWNDINKDGLWQDVTEPPLATWKIYLFKDGVLVDSVLTQPNSGMHGYYEFTNLGPGNYSICEALQSGWMQTYPGNSGCHDVIGVSGVNVSAKSFGNWRSSSLFCTYTMGGWGTVARGFNPGTLRDAFFDVVYPTELYLGLVGVPNRYYVRLDASVNVQNFLPSSGKSVPLTKNYINPIQTQLANTLAGQLAAAKLNVAYDDAMLMWHSYEGTGMVGNLVYASGKFAGKSVRQVLAIADTILAGGTVSGVTASQVTDALGKFNKNFDECKIFPGVYPDLFTVLSVPQSSKTSAVSGSEIPDNFALHQNYPNPFNPSTKIQYTIGNAGFVSLKVFNLLGHEVATLVNSNQEAGSYTVSFNTNEAKLNLASGVYFYRLEAGSFVSTKKLILMK